MKNNFSISFAGTIAENEATPKKTFIQFPVTKGDNMAKGTFGEASSMANTMQNL